jgi:hypothetical protein
VPYLTEPKFVCLKINAKPYQTWLSRTLRRHVVLKIKAVPNLTLPKLATPSVTLPILAGL